MMFTSWFRVARSSARERERARAEAHELRSLDAELTPYGGCARGDMDDIYVVGPVRAVFVKV